MLSYLIPLLEDSELVPPKDFVLHLQLLKWVDAVQGPGLIVLRLMTFTGIPANAPA